MKAGFMLELVTGPVAVSLDDLQWADESSLVVVHGLARLAASCRLLLVDALLLSPVLLAAAIPLAVPAASGLAERPRSGLAMTRRTRPGSSCSGQDAPA
jgi:hypothetical protein